MSNDMEVQFEHPPDSLVMRVSGDLRLWGRPGEQDRPLSLLRAEPPLPRQVILNMSKITRLDTSGIGGLVRILIECSKRGSELRVVLPGGIPGEALRRLRVFEACPHFESEAAALEPAGQAEG